MDDMFFVAATAIIRKDGKYLICKRHPDETIFPNKWCLPGGRLDYDDFSSSPKDTDDHWLEIVDVVLKREIREETNLEINNIAYVTSIMLDLGKGKFMLILSMFADYLAGDIHLAEDELTDHAWISADQAKDYDLIDGIVDQIVQADKKFSQKV